MVAPATCSAAVTRTWAAAAAAMLPSATVMLARPLARAAPLRWVLAVGAASGAAMHGLGDPCELEPE